MTIQYAGGYYLFNDPIVRGFGGNAHTANDLTQLSNYTVEAINYIQETPWQMNPFMVEWVAKFFEAGENLTIETKNGEDVVLRVAHPLNPRLNPDEPTNNLIPKEQWASLSKEGRQSLKQKRAEVLTRFEEELGEYRATDRIFTTAKDMAQFDQFFFPHNLDFRTRIYPIPTDLTPQSSDFSKGMLRFARPTLLGKEGFFWLGVMVASHWGEDKLSPKERFEFAKTYLLKGMIEACVDDPFTNREWLQADKPFQFLAAAHEWVWANRMPNPYEFMSRQPGNLDGSCNGAQHLSIMAKDTVGATSTNCRADWATGGERYDLYMEVADRVWEQVQKDADEGNPVALEWIPKMQDAADRRKVVKRSVMTVPYGVTEFGVADFMIKDKHVARDADNQWDSARYMRDLIMGAIEGTLSSGRALQRWFMNCALTCASAGLPLVWDTPVGSKVTQAYRNLIQKRVRSFDTRFYIYEEPKQDEDDDEFYMRVGMNEKKMVTAAPPNVVHSCDASHLQITVCRMSDAGIKDFSMIHDSFGCPLAHVGLMRDILRQSVVDMYEGDYLSKFKASVEGYSGLTMPPLPAMGDFDITEILDSEFFFA